MIIYCIQNLNWTLYKIAASKIELYFIKIVTQIIISSNSFRLCFWCGKALPYQHV